MSKRISVLLDPNKLCAGPDLEHTLSTVLQPFLGRYKGEISEIDLKKAISEHDRKAGNRGRLINLHLPFLLPHFFYRKYLKSTGGVESNPVSGVLVNLDALTPIDEPPISEYKPIKKSVEEIVKMSSRDVEPGTYLSLTSMDTYAEAYTALKDKFNYSFLLKNEYLYRDLNNFRQGIFLEARLYPTHCFYRDIDAPCGFILSVFFRPFDEEIISQVAGEVCVLFTESDEDICYIDGVIREFPSPPRSGLYLHPSEEYKLTNPLKFIKKKKFSSIYGTSKFLNKKDLFRSLYGARLKAKPQKKQNVIEEAIKDFRKNPVPQQIKPVEYNTWSYENNSAPFYKSAHTTTYSPLCTTRLKGQLTDDDVTKRVEFYGEVNERVYNVISNQLVGEWFPSRERIEVRNDRVNQAKKDEE